MLLYDVPQTDSTSEAAMAALVARLRASCPKRETIPLESAVAGTDASLALKLSEIIGDIVSALGDHLGPGVGLLQWDAALDGKCRTITYRDWMNSRGRVRDAAADTSIDIVADEARAYLTRLRPSGDVNGKTENPIYVAGTSEIGDRARFKSSRKADGWVEEQRRARGF